MLKLVTLAALPLILAGVAQACPFQTQASARPMILADNSPTSTQTPAAGDPAKKTDSVAFPNSPNGSPAASDKGAPVVTDKAACAGGTGPTATCGDSPKPSQAADTSDVKITTPTTVDGTAPK
jgi:hypothetical protein